MAKEPDVRVSFPDETNHLFEMEIRIDMRRVHPSELAEKATRLGVLAQNVFMQHFLEWYKEQRGIDLEDRQEWLPWVN